MHVEDETIAQILGHSGTGAVKYYRKFGNKAMAEETKTVRESMDEVLSQLMQGWRESESRKNGMVKPNGQQAESKSGTWGNRRNAGT